MPHKIKALKAWFDEVWVQGNLSAIPELLATNAYSSGIMGDMTFTENDTAEFVEMVRAMLGPIQVSMPVIIAQDDWLSALVKFKSHDINTGAPVEVAGHIIARFDERRMVEVYNGFDALMMFEQLGRLPPNAMAVMLGGTALR